MLIKKLYITCCRLVVVIIQHRLSEARFLHSPFMFQEAEFLSQFDKKDVQDVDVCSTAECLAAGELINLQSAEDLVTLILHSNFHSYLCHFIVFDCDF